MREILFRGKVADEPDEWVQGYLRDAETIFQQTRHKKSKCCDYGFFSVKPETVGQYTGLKDKNGTKIFEGDIIKIPEDWDKYGINAGELFEVYFDYGGFRLKPKIYKDCRGFWLEDDGEFEIISNIHDNPKLLEGL